MSAVQISIVTFCFAIAMASPLNGNVRDNDDYECLLCKHGALLSSDSQRPGKKYSLVTCPSNPSLVGQVDPGRLPSPKAEFLVQ